VSAPAAEPEPVKEATVEAQSAPVAAAPPANTEVSEGSPPSLFTTKTKNECMNCPLCGPDSISEIKNCQLRHLIILLIDPRSGACWGSRS